MNETKSPTPHRTRLVLHGCGKREQKCGNAADRPDFKIARMEQVRLKEPGIVEVTFHHLLGKNDEVSYQRQSVEIGLFSRE
jgi:hypothetical protein